MFVLAAFGQGKSSTKKFDNGVDTPAKASPELQAILEKLKPDGLLTDFGKYLHADSKQEIESDLDKFSSDRNVDFAVVILELLKAKV